MEEVQVVLKLVEGQNSPDNNLRRASELEFNQLVSEDPTKVCYVLIHAPMDANYPVDLKQSCLLHLRRLVPKYWSMAFQSFSGNPISQDLKSVIRESLIKLVVSAVDTKIRNSASYVIVQIAAADYPDEWPDLLGILYEFTKNFDDQTAVEGSLKVLTDLFDDLVTEEQFWDEHIGSELIEHISLILSRDGLKSSVKINAIELYKNVLTYLTSPEAFSTEERKRLVYQHIPFVCELFYSSIKKSVKCTTDDINSNSIDFIECKYRSLLYWVLNSLVGTFNKRITSDFKRFLLLELLNDFNLLNAAYMKINNLNLEMDTKSWCGDIFKDITDILNEVIGLLSLLQNNVPIHSVLDSNTYEIVVRQLLTVACLPTEGAYSDDFNTFITESTGLSGSVTVRDSISELFIELNPHDSNRIFNHLIGINSMEDSSWTYLEARFFILESICENGEIGLDQSTQISHFFYDVMNLLDANANSKVNPLVTARVILMLPKFLEKFKGRISSSQYKDHIATYNNNVAAFALSYSIYMSNQADSDESVNFIKAAALIACTNYQELVTFDTDFKETEAFTTQQSLFTIINNLLDDSEEDTLPVLLEALSTGISINHDLASRSKVDNGVSVVDLVLKVSFKDPSNVQSNIEASDCLKTLLEHIDYSSYVSLCEKSLPLLLEIIDESIVNNQVEYSSRLDLTFDLLDQVIESAPSSGSEEKSFPPQIFNYIYPNVKKLLLLATDDQILQSGGSVFNSLIQNATDSFLQYTDAESGETGLQSLLSIVSKFLSLELSDSAALNCGTIVTSLINKFQQQLSDEFLSQIISATAQRLLVAKEVITIENLVMLFCNLVLLSPESMINYLGNNLILKDPTSGEEKTSLSLILPIWFQSFEVTRGYEKIKQNALALAKLFSLSDQRIESMVVNGDLIPYEGDKILTRSMAKSMPDRYTQISASLKILKLLAGELEFQCQQPNAEDYLPDANEDDAVDGGDDEGWEDMEDIGVPNYDKLKSYIDSDDEETEEEPSDDDLKNLLIHFFKECASKNLGNFSKYYEQLSDTEKKTITENVLF